MARKCIVLLACLLVSFAAAAAEKKYGPGATDTEIKIGNIMPYQRSGFGLCADRQDPSRLYQDDQRRRAASTAARST